MPAVREGGARSALRPQIALLPTLRPSGVEQTSPAYSWRASRGCDPEVQRCRAFPRPPGPCHRHWGGRWAKAAAQESERAQVDNLEDQEAEAAKMRVSASEAMI